MIALNVLLWFGLTAAFWAVAILAAAAGMWLWGLAWRLLRLEKLQELWIWGLRGRPLPPPSLRIPRIDLRDAQLWGWLDAKRLPY
jgi:hypothetical protein